MSFRVSLGECIPFIPLLQGGGSTQGMAFRVHGTSWLNMRSEAAEWGINLSPSFRAFRDGRLGFRA